MCRSVVCTEAWPSRNWICSSSPPHPWQRRAQLRRRSRGARLSMLARLAHRSTAYQTTLAVTPASCRAPFFKTRLNTVPLLTPEWRSQTSTSPSHQAGTGTVRSRPPLPTKSTTTQSLSLNCSWSSFKLTTSERRNPHPSNNPSAGSANRSQQTHRPVAGSRKDEG